MLTRAHHMGEWTPSSRCTMQQGRPSIARSCQEVQKDYNDDGGDDRNAQSFVASSQFALAAMVYLYLLWIDGYGTRQ